jgi:hypothetical protein
MRSLALLTAASLGLASLAWAADKAAPAKPAKVEDTSGSCGTTIDFFDTPKEAAKQAAKDEKLVLVLHVSGNFEDPRFT